MAIAHSGRLTADRELNRAAKAAAFVALFVECMIGGVKCVGDFHAAGPFI
jgi:hypothetical protein